jgi:hypothetical protein
MWVRHWCFGIGIRGGFEVVEDNTWDTSLAGGERRCGSEFGCGGPKKNGRG